MLNFFPSKFALICVLYISNFNIDSGLSFELPMGTPNAALFTLTSKQFPWENIMVVILKAHEH